MSKPQTRCWHVMIGTYCSWLPGDLRGFRSRDHRIHSSGDYKHRPPVHEHEGLREYHKKRHPDGVQIPKSHRVVAAQTIAELLTSLSLIVWVVSVSATHAHIVAELPLNLREFNDSLGKAKKFSSRQLKKILPGQVWARRDKHILLDDHSHRENAYSYVRDDQGPCAAVWCREGWVREAFVD